MFFAHFYGIIVKIANVDNFYLPVYLMSEHNFG